MAWKKIWTRSYTNRIEEYDKTIKKYLAKIEQIKIERDTLIELMERLPWDFEEQICRMYITTGSLKDTADWLNKIGHRVIYESLREKRLCERKYNTNDIARIISEQKSNKENTFGAEAGKLYQMNISNFDCFE